jgi:hypothetical protein
MSNLIDQLRAHDPERDGTPAPPIERLLERIEREPASGGREGRGRRRVGLPGSAPGPRRAVEPRSTGPARVARSVIAIGLAAAAVAAVVAVLAGGGNPEPAAPAGADGTSPRLIVHVRSRVLMTQPDGRPIEGVFGGGRGRTVGTMDGPTDRWSTATPRRWRQITRYLPSRRNHAGGGTTEQAYADGRLQTRDSWRRGTRSQVVHPERHPPRRYAATRALREGTADPRAAIEELVATGQVRAMGETTSSDGRRLLRYVGEQPGRDLGRRGSMSGLRTTWLLDAADYRPVEVVTVPTAPPGWRFRGPYPGITNRTVFEVYETLPPTAENLRLLRMGGPTG